MSAKTAIKWTDHTFNIVWGCTKVSPGCTHCYAETFAERFRGVPGHPFEFGFDLRLVPEKLGDPIRWSKPKKIFVNSMSDLFHVDVPIDYIQRVFDIMSRAHWHRFQVLTKRADRLEEISSQLAWSSNIWMGVSVENQKYVHRIDNLRRTDAKVKFLSLEPLLGPLTGLNLTDIDWAIVGGESGYGARPIKEDWVLSIRKQCRDFDVPFFFKQWGGFNKKKTGRLLEGRTFDEMPRLAYA